MVRLAHAFEGWLLKFGSQEFPLRYLALDGCDSTPDQRTEIDSYRDADNLLHRETSPNHKTKLEYNTVDNLTLEDKIIIQQVMEAGLQDIVQRKYRITYWNDEKNEYETGDFYVPDITFRQKRVDRKRNMIIYGSIRIAMIEY